eukprot:CAMPEP_0178565808 /NCGR_PEP_ID=MMETSP0697-20121206/14386_1 /TAXON_ID=265572 /ORGANISM="Extubocellulus spinifer, Strain CCMP396" /LENGTH=147 /DNA_ID=CAMNT_0020199493 /DNA_START=758 /DNA_END=1199 /DNA_ORIENTATION=+
MAIGNFMGKSWPFGRICPLVDALLGITIVIISTYQGHRLGVLLAEQRQRIRGMGGQTSEQNGASDEDEDEDEDEIEMADIENDNVAHLVAAASSRWCCCGGELLLGQRKKKCIVLKAQQEFADGCGYRNGGKGEDGTNTWYKAKRIG